MTRFEEQFAASTLQLYPPLDDATEAALRASIQRFGVLVPVVHDQYGRTIDGHHRSRIADELGVGYRIDIRSVGDEEEAQEIARTLNADRRHLAPDQRRPVVIALREDGHSIRAIAGALGVNRGSIEHDLKQTRVVTTTPDRVEGQDGKSYPAKAKEAEPAPKKKAPNGGFRNRTDPFEITSEKGRLNANGQYARLRDGVSEISGICRGLKEVDLGMVAAACSPDELRAWVAKTGEAATFLRKLKTDLKEVGSRG